VTQLFVPGEGGGFEIRALEAERYRLSRAELEIAGDRPAAPALVANADGPAPPGAVLLLRIVASDAADEVAATDDASWAAVASPDARLRVNGEPIAIGLAVLRHRDELRIDGAAPFYLSTERLAAVEACARDDAPRCPRCAQPIERGEPCVRCPGCGVVHHELAERPCWTHLPSCALCDQPTDLAAGLRWSPEEL
jgi:hypothetical protein